MPVTSTVFGRQSEKMAIDGMLTSAGQGSRCLILDGEMGIGKTTLLEWAKSAARKRSICCRP